MTKRILVFALVLALCCSLSLNVFAASASKTGSTSGGTVGTLNTSASLAVNKNTATATTSCAYSDVALSTTLNYTYLNSSGHSQTSSDTGSSSVTVGNSLGLGQKAVSYHTVSGGSSWGSWTCSLSASV